VLYDPISFTICANKCEKKEALFGDSVGAKRLLDDSMVPVSLLNGPQAPCRVE